MGSVIGHEISHNFDDQGALFDSTGRLRNWWTTEDFAHFKAASTKLVKQYDQYRPFPDLALNGQQVLGENIADLGGLAVSYDGWQISLKGKPAPVVNGFTGDQQFFISHAQSYRGQGAGAGTAPADHYRRAFTRRISRGHHTQPRRVVCGIRRDSPARSSTSRPPIACASGDLRRFGS